MASRTPTSARPLSPWVGVAAVLALAAVAGWARWWSEHGLAVAAVLGVLAAFGMARPGSRKVVLGLAAAGGALAGLVLLPLDIVEPRSNRARVDIQHLQLALRVYWQHRGHYPDEKLGLRELVDAGILEREPVDPWGAPYLYQLEGSFPVVRTLGKDGADGGTGEDADLSSLQLLPEGG